jgi:type IV pilus assembly protein PilF
MRHDPMRAAIAAALLALAGCAATPDVAGGGARPRSVETDMSRTGLANVRLAQTYLAAGKVELALDRANRALKSDPSSAEAHIVIAMIRERLGDRERANDHYLRAAKYAPDEGYVLNATAAWLCKNGRAAEADAMFARATDDPFYKQREQAFFNAGKCATDAGDLGKAEAYLRRGLAAAPEDRALLEQMVRVKVRQGDLMGARAFFQRRESLGPPGPEMLELAARIEQGAGDAAAAQRYRQQLQTQHPGYRPATTDGSQP